MKTDPIYQKNFGETRFHNFRNEDQSKFLGKKIFTTNLKNQDKIYESPCIKNVKVQKVDENNIKGTIYIHKKQNKKFDQRLNTEPIQKNAQFHKFREENPLKDIHPKQMKFTLPNLEERIITALKEQKGGIMAGDKNQFTKQYKKIIYLQNKQNQSNYKQKRAFSQFDTENQQIDFSQVYPYGFKQIYDKKIQDLDVQEKEKFKTQPDFQLNKNQSQTQENNDFIKNYIKNNTVSITLREIEQKNKQKIQQIQEQQKSPIKKLVKKIRLEDYTNLSPRKLGQQPIVKTHFQGAKTVEIKYNQMYKNRFLDNQNMNKTQKDKQNNIDNDFQFYTENDEDQIIQEEENQNENKLKQNKNKDKIFKYNNSEISEQAKEILYKCNVKKQKYKDTNQQYSTISSIYYSVNK